MSNTAHTDAALSDFVARTATEYNIPGVSVGIWADGREIFAAHGVTSIENPLPVTENTLFCLGSIAKTFTSTTVMHLVAQGKIDLDAPVRRYVPELVLADARAAATMTVKNLLNHTSGLGVRLVVETGDGDDALAGFVARMPELEQIAPVGERASYSQAAYNLLGRVVEKVTGLTFEEAVRTLALEPAGLRQTFYSLDHVISRRFAVGHNPGEQEGELVVARQWKDTRGNNPGGDIASTATDLLRWGRMHLRNGRNDDGVQALPAKELELMKQQTVELVGSSLGDGFGLCWFLRDIPATDDGGPVRTVAHGGSTNGQFADLLLVPERNFAIAVMSNGPDSIACDQAIIRWALEHYLGVIDRDPEPLPYDAESDQQYVGHYEVDVMDLDITVGESGLLLKVTLKPEIRAASEKEIPADYPAFEFGLLPGEGENYIITSGAFVGQRGFFSRAESGAIKGVDLAGRIFTRIAD
ncbi:beta-lactamase family protein [Nocardia sp. NEAU-G5]|uniref:Beta-lactamase family protein n=1 Tax=Nocardia albiluteola TaxID=2842303 RepID=A0ABS6AS69_9NOCA|nr:serine hydrolase domain-containing protein [Nocardia albiluteola]MBU3060872.1 beta-lactamase family protein [Nocardia albiluteola]